MANGFKTGGRGKGTPNKDNAVIRERIEQEADPIGFLCRIVLGEKIECAPVKESAETVQLIPTLDQRLSAAQVLAKKILPDLSATELTGDANHNYVAIMPETAESTEEWQERYKPTIQ